jgi:uncharacterized protein
MSGYTPDPKFVVESEAQLRALFPATHDLAIRKVQSALDKHATDFIARSPFLCIGTQDSRGRADVSPRGDPAGFVRVLDNQTFVIPDRPGNNRLDTLSNILSNPQVGILFLIPGFEETLRVNGKATLVTDNELLATMSVNGRTPTLGIVVAVQEVFLHCAKALRRSRLWYADALQDRKAMPSLSGMILDQTQSLPSDPNEMKKIDEGLEEDYRTSMY